MHAFVKSISSVTSTIIWLVTTQLLVTGIVITGSYKIQSESSDPSLIELRLPIMH